MTSFVDNQVVLTDPSIVQFLQRHKTNGLVMQQLFASFRATCNIAEKSMGCKSRTPNEMTEEEVVVYTTDMVRDVVLRHVGSALLAGDHIKCDDLLDLVRHHANYKRYTRQASVIRGLVDQEMMACGYKFDEGQLAYVGCRLQR